MSVEVTLLPENGGQARHRLRRITSADVGLLRLLSHHLLLDWGGTPVGVLYALIGGGISQQSFPAFASQARLRRVCRPGPPARRCYHLMHLPGCPRPGGHCERSKCRECPGVSTPHHLVAGSSLAYPCTCSGDRPGSPFQRSSSLSPCVSKERAVSRTHPCALVRRPLRARIDSAVSGALICPAATLLSPQRGRIMRNRKAQGPEKCACLA
jgi:hypothetical protein